jgi:hypothetical protein
MSLGSSIAFSIISPVPAGLVFLHGSIEKFGPGTISGLKTMNEVPLRRRDQEKDKEDVDHSLCPLAPLSPTPHFYPLKSL